MTAAQLTGDDTPATPPPSGSRISPFRGREDLPNSTNLDWFLKSTAPVVKGMQFRKTSMNGWGPDEGGFQPYFVLGDLWDSYIEWSAYGAGVPLLLSESDYAMQYYVPYLSGIQLYLDPSVPAPRTRMLSEESDADSSWGSSDGVSDCEADRGPNYSVRQGFRGLSVSNKTSNGSSSDESERVSPPGVLVFEYFEQDSPSSRSPLRTQISELASQFPELMTYRSRDLSPASWFCVAWYPICRIPTGQSLKNLESSFLTFHSLSTPSRGDSGAQNEWKYPFGSQPTEVPRDADMDLKLSLPTFGLTSYKFNAAFWEHSGADGHPKANTLSQAADDWLELLDVCLPDYAFFASRNSQQR